MNVQRLVSVLILGLFLVSSVAAERATKSINVWNYKGYSALTPGGFASKSTKVSKHSLAHRANNPANIRLRPSNWSRRLPGLAGTLASDSKGRKLFRFYSPEHGFVALYKLIHDVHGFGRVGSIRLDNLGYALSNGSSKKQEKLIRAWIRNSNGQLSRRSSISFKNEDRMVVLFRAIARAESSGKLPYTKDQIRAGVRLGRAYIKGQKTARISFDTNSTTSAGVQAKVAKPLPRPVHIYHVEPAGNAVKALLPSLGNIPDVTPEQRAAALSNANLSLRDIP